MPAKTNRRETWSEGGEIWDPVVRVMRGMESMIEIESLVQLEEEEEERDKKVMDPLAG